MCDKYIFDKNSFRPFAHSYESKFPDLMSLGTIHVGDCELPAVTPFFYRESLAICHDHELHILIANLIEFWSIQILTQCWGRVRLCIYDPTLESKFEVLESAAHILASRDRKDEIIFLRNRTDLESAVNDWKNIASKRKSRLAIEGSSNWKDLMVSDSTAEYFIIVLSDVSKLSAWRFTDDLINLIAHGPRLGMLFWNLVTPPSEDLTRYEYESVEKWVYRVIDASDCVFDVSNVEINIRGEVAKYQPFLTYAELGGIRSTALTSLEKKLFSEFIMNKIYEESEEEKSNYIEIAVGQQNGQKFYIKIGPGIEVYHGMLAGGTGKGKTVFLKHLIVSVCEKYTPEQIQFYVFDFKDGVDMMCLEGLSHIPYLHTVCNDPQAVIDALKEFEEEATVRNEIFKSAQRKGFPGGDLFNYNKWALTSGAKPFPFRVLVIDETAKLFILTKSDYHLQKELVTLLKTVAITGRSPGLMLLLASQSFSGIPAIDDLSSHIQLRMSLQLNSSGDCSGIFASGNKVAFHKLRSNKKVREILINTEAGRIDGNMIVQLEKMDHDSILPRIEKLRINWPSSNIALKLKGSDIIRKKSSTSLEVNQEKTKTADLLNDLFLKEKLPEFPKGTYPGFLKNYENK